MTGREIIRGLVNSCQDLDKEVPLIVLQRDLDNCVESETQYTLYHLINGKILVEDAFRSYV